MLLSFDDSRLYIGSALFLFASCAILVMDMAYRFFTSGRLEPLFRSVTTFSLEVIATFLATIAALNAALSRQNVLDPWVIVALIFLLAVWIVTGVSFWVLRKWTDEDVTNLLAKKIQNPQDIPIISKLARELIDVELYPPTQGIMNAWSGNESRRKILIELITHFKLLKQNETLVDKDLILQERRGLALPKYWLPGLTVASFLITVVLVFRALAESA